MKRIIHIAIILLLSQVTVNGQAICPIDEHFDLTNTFTSTGTPGWSIDNTYSVTSPNSIRGQFGLGAGNTSDLTSASVSTIGNPVVKLKFKHICKLNSFDGGVVEINTGSGWVQLKTAPAANCIYYGNAVTFAQGFGWSFKALSYPLLWQPSVDAAIPDNNTWWKEETFDISTLAGNQANVQIRFSAVGVDNNGMAGNYGWLIDDVQLCYSTCELDNPVITPIAPLLVGAVYNPGPYTVCFDMTDTSSVLFSELYFNLNNTGFQATNTMSQVTATKWCGSIPGPIACDDSVTWYVEAYDGSCNTNVGTYPAATPNKFNYSCTIDFPFCDYFDSPSTFWTDSSAAGSSWELGIPNFAPTNSPLTFPNSWDIDLNSGYQNNSNALLTSGTFNFTNNLNPTLSLWYNYETQAGADGVRLQYSTNGGATFTTLGGINDPCGTNWYNGSITGGPGWTDASNGWTPASYDLACGTNTIPGSDSVQFRFVFRSDGLTTAAGFSLDNFCIDIKNDQDLGVTSITAPSGGVPAGNSVAVNILMQNFGNAVQTACNIVTTIDTGTGPQIQNTFPWTGSLMPGDQLAVVLPNITVPPGLFTLCAYTVLVGDTNAVNDTFCIDLLGIPTFTLSYNDNFDGAVNWYNETDQGTSLWELGTPSFASTNSAHSAPNSWDVDLLSGYTDNSITTLYSPYFNFTGTVNPLLEFWQNYDTDEDADGVTMQYRVGSGGWNTLGFPNDGNGINWANSFNIGASGLPGWSGTSNGWIKSSYDLINVGAITNQPSVQFRFIFASDGFGTGSGHSIDDFTIIQPAPNDVGVIAITSPPSTTIALDTNDVIVKLKNFGTTAQTNPVVYYRVDNNAVVGPITYTGTINPGQKVDVPMPPFIAAQGPYSICAWSALPADANTSNDSTCSSFVGVPIVSLAFLDNFENGNIYAWTDSTGAAGTSWQLGTPNWKAITAAHSPVNAWMTNISTGYDDDAECYLQSPYFDFSDADSVRLSFWQNFKAEGGWDGTRLEYTTDGINWTILGTAPNDQNGINWYSDDQLNSSLLPAWEGNSSSLIDFPTNNNVKGWMKSTYELLSVGPDLNNQSLPVRFRFVFTSDASINAIPLTNGWSGYAIDDFKLRLPCANDFSLLSIDQPVNGPAGVTVIPQVTIQNDGFANATSANIVYCITPQSTGVTTCVTYTWNGILPPTAVMQPFLPPFSMPVGQFDLCIHVDLAGDCDHTNDSLCITLVGIPTYAPTYSTPFTDNFDGINTGWTTFNGANNNSSNQWEWGTPNFGATTGAFSAPKCWDVNLNTAYASNGDIYLLTPFFNFTPAGLTGDPEISFWHRYETDPLNDGVTVEYRYDNTGNWTVLGSVFDFICGTNSWYTENLGSGDDGFEGSSAGIPGNTNGWYKSLYRMNTACLAGMNAKPIVQFRFRFFSTGFTTGDGYSIDDFAMKIPVPISISPIDLYDTNRPELIFPNQQVNFTTKLYNEGTTTLNFVTASLYVDNNLISQDLVDFTATGGAIDRDTSRLYSFQNNWTATPGEHRICVVTSNPNGITDLNPTNDTICYYITVFENQSVYPFCTSFESGNKWVTLNAISYINESTWEIGSPSQTNLNGTHSGSKCWTLDATGNYLEGDSSGLFSPLLSVSVFKCYKVSFWQQFYTEQFQDGGSFAYSLDSGAKWTSISFQNTPYTNFFNYNNVSSLAYENGFTGNSFGWKYIEKIIRPNVNDQMIFRWRFASDLDSTSEGWSIDDFCFEDLGFCNPLGINELSASGLGLGQNYPNPFNGHTTIEYQIPSNGDVQLIFTDAVGRMIRTFNATEAKPGTYTVDFDSNELKPGIYFYSLIYNGERITKRMMVTD